MQDERITPSYTDPEYGYRVPSVERIAVEPGQRVTVDGFSYGDAVFIGWGQPEWTCSPNHTVWPACRIAMVEMDRYGKTAVWESKVRVNGQPIYVAV